MDVREFFDLLMKAGTVGECKAALAAWKAARDTHFEERPVGNRENNRGTIEVATDASRSLLERVINAHDAVLELEHEMHGGRPDCKTPREAAMVWLGVPEKEGLAKLSVAKRQELAKRTVVTIDPGDGPEARTISVQDLGTGIAADRLEGTILSLNASNKMQKFYLAGTYGQGGSSTFVFSKFVFIASRRHGTDEIVFTLVFYQDLPPDHYKSGHYVYVVDDGKPMVISAKDEDMPHGTLVKHFGFDLTGYTGSFGPRSVYGSLQRLMFDPVSSIRVQNRVHKWNRVIKGSRNALNGAVDDEDEGKGPELDHNNPMAYINLDELGQIGIEYWVLKQTYDDKGKPRKTPTDVYVDPKNPIILTNNGQNQGELSAQILKKDADLPYLKTRIICHINCDQLSAIAKRTLFSSTREHSREGLVLQKIKQELIDLLKADDELRRLNDEAREQSLKHQDDAADQQMRKQVARLLRIAGNSVADAGGSKKKEPGEGRPERKRGVFAKVEPIATVNPPTYIKFVWEKDEGIPFHATQRRYLRIETDAGSEYHDPSSSNPSRINVVVGDDLKVVGTTPLRGGRMRVIVECKPKAELGSQGTIKVELYRSGMSALADEKPYSVVPPPTPKAEGSQSTYPEFNLIAVDGPDDDRWQYVCNESEDADVAKHASGVIPDEGTLNIYFSTQYPPFVQEFKKFELKDPALAVSFQQRYSLWLAVHALLMHQDEEQYDGPEIEEVDAAELHRQERCRLASVAVMVANQEVRTGVLAEEVEA